MLSRKSANRTVLCFATLILTVAPDLSAVGRKYELPSYPLLANRLRMAGRVDLRVHVAEGSVARIETLGFHFYKTVESEEGSPRISPLNLIYPKEFKEIVESAVSLWRFPDSENGNFQVRFEFELTDKIQPYLHERECFEVESQSIKQLGRLVVPRTVRVISDRTGRVVHID